MWHCMGTQINKGNILVHANKRNKNLQKQNWIDQLCAADHVFYTMIFLDLINVAELFLCEYKFI